MTIMQILFVKNGFNAVFEVVESLLVIRPFRLLTRMSKNCSPLKLCYMVNFILESRFGSNIYIDQKCCP